MRYWRRPERSSGGSGWCRRASPRICCWPGPNREGDRLRHWIADVCADEQASLAGFAAGLLPDLDAVVYGMSTDCSSGPVEGSVNDLKALKRSMFGRAKAPLLRKRLLLTAADRRPDAPTTS